MLEEKTLVSGSWGKGEWRGGKEHRVEVWRIITYTSGHSMKENYIYGLHFWDILSLFFTCFLKNIVFIVTLFSAKFINCSKFTAILYLLLFNLVNLIINTCCSAVKDPTRLFTDQISWIIADMIAVFAARSGFEAAKAHVLNFQVLIDAVLGALAA